MMEKSLLRGAIGVACAAQRHRASLIKPMKISAVSWHPSKRYAGSSDCELLCRGHFKIEMGFA